MCIVVCAATAPGHCGLQRRRSSTRCARGCPTGLRIAPALTLTLPAGLPDPRERSLPPAAPCTHIDRVWWADGAWRVVSVQDPPPAPNDNRRQPSGPTPTAPPGQTVAVSAQSVERLAT